MHTHAYIELYIHLVMMTISSDGNFDRFRNETVAPSSTRPSACFGKPRNTEAYFERSPGRKKKIYKHGGGVSS